MAQDKEAAITVLLPVFNAMPFLPQALESLMRQTERQIHIIAIDDGSTDDSGAYLRSVHDHRLQTASRSHEGLVAALNWGLGLAQTPLVARMDADDICDPRRFRLQREYLEAHPDCALVGCSANHIGKDDISGVWPVYMPTEHQAIVEAMLDRKSAIIHPTVMFRLEAVREVGGYSQDFWPAEDYELFLRLGLRGKLANIPECLYSIRLHRGSVTAKAIVRGQRRFDDARLAYEEQYRPPGAGRPSRRKTRSVAEEIVLVLDSRAVYLYRQGITRWVDGARYKGICLIALSVVASPWRALEYVRRRFAATRERHSG